MHLFSIENLTAFFSHYGYWTVLVGLVLESAGLPVPGETVLLLASSLAATQGSLHIGWIVVIAIGAASTGDNIGYWIGRHGGRPLLDRYGRILHLEPATLKRGEDLIARHGPIAVFLARFIAGLRVLNGLLAGSLKMEWRRFFLFDLLGAICWVSLICSLGFFFGSRLPWLMHLLGRTGMVLFGVAVLGALSAWWIHKRHSATPSDA